MTTVGFAEIDDFACGVLAKRFPHIPNYGDVTKLDGTQFRDFHGVDVITGGFPCTDLSHASKGSHKGLEGSQSGLFYELARLVIEADPKWVVLENTPRVLKYMQEIRNELYFHYWDGRIFEALEYGALCRRKRAFIVGCSVEGGAEKVLDLAEEYKQALCGRGNEDVFPMCLPWKGGVSLERLGSCVVEIPTGGHSGEEANTSRIREGDGVPGRMDGRRYLALGNSIVPLVAKIIMCSLAIVQQAGEADEP